MSWMNDTFEVETRKSRCVSSIRNLKTKDYFVIRNPRFSLLTINELVLKIKYE